MKIKDYKCKCGHSGFFFADKGNQKGIYCSYCGKWLKWADKDEQNLAMKQDPILNKIYADIQRLRGCSCSCSDGIIDDVEDILDKYRGESEET